MSAPRGLGRGLAALLGEPAAAEGGVATVPIGDLRPGRLQPRSRFDDEEIERLAASLRRDGMVQPIVARFLAGEEGMLEIVAGERRWRAAQRAQLHEVPVILRTLSDREALELALVENLQRQDLGPLEEAAGYERLRREFGLTQAAVAVLVGKSRAHVANTVRLLQLPDAVRAMLDRGQLSAGHGRALLAAAQPLALARRVLDEGLSVRQTEALAAGRPRAPARRPAGGDADTRALQDRLVAAVGVKVEIVGRGEKGRLALFYQSLEQLDAIVARLERPPR